MERDKCDSYLTWTLSMIDFVHRRSLPATWTAAVPTPPATTEPASAAGAGARLRCPRLVPESPLGYTVARLVHCPLANVHASPKELLGRARAHRRRSRNDRLQPVRGAAAARRERDLPRQPVHRAAREHRPDARAPGVRVRPARRGEIGRAHV